jgi:hypothetical protein
MFDTDIDRCGVDADATLRHVASMQTLRQRAEVAIALRPRRQSDWNAPWLPPRR